MDAETTVLNVATESLAASMGICETPKAVRLNLGAGDIPLAGFTSIDRRNGQDVYPLACADGSVDEIYASHILEHFSHTQTCIVLQHWTSKLKPGGRIRLAVPDLEKIATEYLDGKPVNIQGYLMGGHIDDNDHHGCLFDREALTELMVNAGLERIGEWKSEIQDSASLPISLNLQGFKPIGNQQMPEGVFGVLSAPRFGPIMHMQCAFDALAPLQIQYVTGQGAFWSQVLSDCMEKLLENVSCRYILTMDYDSIFSRYDVLELYRLMEAYPNCGALCPVQSMRGTEMALFGITDKEGKPKTVMYTADFAKHVTPIFTGHFGLTMIRADCLRQLPKPWMCPKPTPSGQWIEGKVDADISFWHNWKKAGFMVGLANRVVVGHLEEVIKWPGDKFQPIYQETKDYNASGIPAEVRR